MAQLRKLLQAAAQVPEGKRSRRQIWLPRLLVLSLLPVKLSTHVDRYTATIAHMSVTHQNTLGVSSAHTQTDSQELPDCWTARVTHLFTSLMGLLGPKTDSKVNE